jgi:hypothetical protein
VAGNRVAVHEPLIGLVVFRHDSGGNAECRVADKVLPYRRVGRGGFLKLRAVSSLLLRDRRHLVERRGVRID